MTVPDVEDRPRGWLALIVGTVAAGGIGWVIDVAVLWTLAVVLGVPTSLAAACGLIAGGAVNFLVNRVVHVGSELHRRREVARYGVLFALNVVVVAVSVPVLADLIGRSVPDRGLALLGAKVIVTAVLLLANAYAYHRWVFRQSPIQTNPRAR